MKRLLERIRRLIVFLFIFRLLSNDFLRYGCAVKCAVGAKLPTAPASLETKITLRHLLLIMPG